MMKNTVTTFLNKWTDTSWGIIDQDRSRSGVLSFLTFVANKISRVGNIVFRQPSQLLHRVTLKHDLVTLECLA
jgi:hypothetical protein